MEIDLIFIVLFAALLWNWHRKRFYKRELRMTRNQLEAVTIQLQQQREQARFFYCLWYGKDLTTDEILEAEIIE
jgi:hypothetical protein